MRIKIFLFACILSANMFSQVTKIDTLNFEFRKTNWDYTKQQVKDSEKEVPTEENENLLTYKSRIFDFDCKTTYEFVESKLITCAYYFKVKHDDKNDYISDYNLIKDYLTKKYSSSINKQLQLNDDLKKSKEDFSKKGIALSKGELSYSSEWEDKLTDITLLLSGKKGEITLVSIYSNKKYQEDKKKKKRPKKLFNLK